MTLDIIFHLRRARLANLTSIHILEIELEDDLITFHKWRREVQTSGTHPSTSIRDPIVKRLVNDVLSLKRKQHKNIPSNQVPYQDIIHQQFIYHTGKKLNW